MFTNVQTYGSTYKKLKAFTLLGIPYGESLPVVPDPDGNLEPGCQFYLVNVDPAVEGTYEFTSAEVWRKVSGAVISSVPVIQGIVPIAAVADVNPDILVGDTVITWPAFAGREVEIFRNKSLLDKNDPGDGDTWYTKDLTDDFLTLSQALVAGEKLYIKTL